MKKIFKRLCPGFLAFATIVTALPSTIVHAESKQYWTESQERVGIVEKVMNDGSIGSTFNEGHLILSRLVDTFSSRILNPMQLLSGNYSIAVVLPLEEDLH